MQHYSLEFQGEFLSDFRSQRPSLAAIKFYKRIFRQLNVTSLRIDIINMDTEKRYSYLCSAERLEIPKYFKHKKKGVFKMDYHFIAQRIQEPENNI